MLLDNKRKLVVKIADAKISKSAHDVLVTHSLGSCIGVCIHDRQNKIGGMMHCQLPESKLNATKALSHPFMFVDTGFNLLFESLLAAGAQQKYMKITVAGGATMKNGPEAFEIGKRNCLALRKLLWKKGILIDGQDVGGDIPRTLYLNVDTGSVTVKTGRGLKEL